MRSPTAKLVIFTLILLAFAGTALTFAGSVTAASFMGAGWVLAAVTVIVGAASWRAIARRRERQRLESMRDSALW